MTEKIQVNIDCPECIPQVRMVVRTNKQNGSKFLGCPNWPACTETRPIPIDVALRLAGATPLPGFFGKGWG